MFQPSFRRYNILDSQGPFGGRALNLSSTPSPLVALAPSAADGAPPPDAPAGPEHPKHKYRHKHKHKHRKRHKHKHHKRHKHRFKHRKHHTAQQGGGQPGGGDSAAHEQNQHDAGSQGAAPQSQENPSDTQQPMPHQRAAHANRHPAAPHHDGTERSPTHPAAAQNGRGIAEAGTMPTAGMPGFNPIHPADSLAAAPSMAGPQNAMRINTASLGQFASQPAVNDPRNFNAAPSPAPFSMASQPRIFGIG